MELTRASFRDVSERSDQHEGSILLLSGADKETILVRKKVSVFRKMDRPWCPGIAQWDWARAKEEIKAVLAMVTILSLYLGVIVLWSWCSTATDDMRVPTGEKPFGICYYDGFQMIFNPEDNRHCIENRKVYYYNIEMTFEPTGSVYWAKDGQLYREIFIKQQNCIPREWCRLLGFIYTEECIHPRMCGTPAEFPPTTCTLKFENGKAEATCRFVDTPNFTKPGVPLHAIIICQRFSSSSSGECHHPWIVGGSCYLVYDIGSSFKRMKEDFGPDEWYLIDAHLEL
jgi:hypothetical protein